MSSLSNDDIDALKFKPISCGTWHDILREVTEENHTIVHDGSHTIAKGLQSGLQLESGAAEPLQMIQAMKTHNVLARKNRTPGLRIMARCSCESDGHAEMLMKSLSECCRESITSLADNLIRQHRVNDEMMKVAAPRILYVKVTTSTLAIRKTPPKGCSATFLMGAKDSTDSLHPMQAVEMLAPVAALIRAHA